MASNNASFTKILSSLTKNSCPRECNFHTHTTCSDGSLEPIQLISQASINRLKHLSITDHHTIDAYYIIDQWIIKQKDLGNYVPELWTGIEISCLLKNCLVHVLGFNFELRHSSLKNYITGDSATGEWLRAEYVVKGIHDAGGIAILAHPARYRLSHTELIDTAANIGFDGAEAWYDYEFKSPWSPTEFLCNQIHNQLNELSLYSTCGTDTHGLTLLGR